jgi:hypothetical protein
VHALSGNASCAMHPLSLVRGPKGRSGVAPSDVGCDSLFPTGAVDTVLAAAAVGARAALVTVARGGVDWLVWCGVVAGTAAETSVGVEALPGVGTAVPEQAAATTARVEARAAPNKALWQLCHRRG